MITNVKQLITECMLELRDRQYRKDYADKIISYWNDLSAWMQVQSIQVFNEDVANQYCDTMIGSRHHIFRALRLPYGRYPLPLPDAGYHRILTVR